MARKKMIDGKTVTFVIPYEVEDEITRIAERRKISKAQVYRMMLDAGVQCHKDMEKVGLIQAVDFIYYVKKAVRDKLASNGSKQMSLL